MLTGHGILPGDVEGEGLITGQKQQHDGSNIYQQARGDQMVHTLFPDMGTSQGCRDHHLKKIAVYIQLEWNALADLYSWKGLPHKWFLCLTVMEDLFQPWRRPQVDFFANGFNNKLSVYYSLEREPNVVAHNALMMSWDSPDEYAFPPQPIIRRVLLKVNCSRTRMNPIAPNWGRKLWMSMLKDMLTGDIQGSMPELFSSIGVTRTVLKIPLVLL